MPARRTVVVAGAVVAAVAIACGAAIASTRDGDDDGAGNGAKSRAEGNAQAGRVAPEFALPDLRDDSRTVGLPDGRPAVVNFFASWCVPCEKELPLLRQAAADHGDTVAFLGVDHLDHRDDATAFLDRFGITYPIGYDPGGETAPRYRLPGLPGTVFVRADGTIDSVTYGEIHARELADRLAQLTLQGSAG